MLVLSQFPRLQRPSSGLTWSGSRSCRGQSHPSPQSFREEGEVREGQMSTSCRGRSRLQLPSEEKVQQR